MTVEFRRILVPTDFGALSILALEHAKALATKLGSSLDVVHVVEDRLVTGLWPVEVYGPNLPQLHDSLVRQAENRLAECLTEEERTRFGATRTVLVGLPSHTIVEHAGSTGADLIVMGTHGRTGISHVMIGSVAERIMRTAPCPVLVVRGPARPLAAVPERVAVARV